MKTSLPALKIEPQFREYVWGGTHLRPGQLTAEAWVIHENNRITSGSLSGRTLGDISLEYGEILLGKVPFERTGRRFPILIKLLDCAQWLSLQVHPNDEQAITLEGEGEFGKTEAWHILHADPDAEILCGFKSGISSDDIRQSVRDGTILDVIQNLKMKTGDTIFIRAGTVHALGPGLLVYEVQQTSNITYRVFDWNRPASAGRKLHIDQSLAVLDPEATGHPIPEPDFSDGMIINMIACGFFNLDLVYLEKHVVDLDTHDESFHALTVVEGGVIVSGFGWEEKLSQFDNLMIPAALGKYRLQPLDQKTKVIKSSIERS